MDEYDGSSALEEAPDGVAEPEETPKRSTLARLVEMLILVGIAWVLATGIRTFVVQPFVIPSGSMEPTLLVSDQVLVNRFIYRFEHAKPGDIVVFVSSEDRVTDLIKRVVAVGGQTVEIRNGVVFVDGKRRYEPFVNSSVPDHFNSSAPFRVPDGMVFVMGDNRANSMDSRYIGPQPESAILGRAFAIYWPLGRVRGL